MLWGSIISKELTRLRSRRISGATPSSFARFTSIQKIAIRGYCQPRKDHLGHFDGQVLAGEDEIRPAAAFHELRGGLRERGDDDWQSDRRVAVDVSGERAASELAVNQRFIKCDGARPATWMRRIGGDLNRVLVTVDLLLENVRRHLCLTNEALGDAAAQIG